MVANKPKSPKAGKSPTMGNKTKSALLKGGGSLTTKTNGEASSAAAAEKTSESPPPRAPRSTVRKGVSLICELCCKIFLLSIFPVGELVRKVVIEGFDPRVDPLATVKPFSLALGVWILHAILSSGLGIRARPRAWLFVTLVFGLWSAQIGWQFGWVGCFFFSAKLLEVLFFRREMPLVVLVVVDVNIAIPQKEVRFFTF